MFKANDGNIELTLEIRDWQNPNGKYSSDILQCALLCGKRAQAAIPPRNCKSSLTARIFGACVIT